MSTQYLNETENLLRERLCRKSLPVMLREDLENAKHDLVNILTRTVQFGESNSALIIGAKGSGKSALIRTVLQELKSNSNIDKSLITVTLNGLMQTDDRIALDEITRQLQLENTIGDKVFGSFAETLSFLLEALRNGNAQKSQPILFFLEEFDLFAQHKNQTLLYNLFDITQAGLTPMAVVGSTSRLDVIELLEKRVKSRFSHRQIYICNTWKLEDYVSCFCDCLKLSSTVNKKDSKRKAFVKKWNDMVTGLSKNSAVLDVLERQFHICKEISGLHNLLMMPICKLSEDHPEITPADIADAAKCIFGDSKANILHGVSVLELCLIIAMNHLMNIYEGEPFNFQMVYNEFLKFAQKKSHILQNYTKPVVLKAFEHLIELELLKSKDNLIATSSKLQKEYRPMILLVDHTQLKEAVNKYPGCPTDVKQWAESSIIM